MLFFKWRPSMKNRFLICRLLLHTCMSIGDHPWRTIYVYCTATLLTTKTGSIFLGCLLIKPGPLWRRNFGTNWSNQYPSYQRTGTTVPVPLITRTEPNPWLRNRKWHANQNKVRLISKQVIVESKFKISWYSPLFWPTEKTSNNKMIHVFCDSFSLTA